MPSGGSTGVPVGRPGPRQRARHRVEHRIGRPPRRPRPGSAEVGDRQRDQMPEPIGQLFARGAVRDGLTGNTAVDHDVGARRRARSTARRSAGSSGSRTALRLFALCSANRRLTPRSVGARGARRAAARRLDLQHVGAEVGQQPAHRIAVIAGQVEHPQRRQQLQRTVVVGIGQRSSRTADCSRSPDLGAVR